MENIEQQLAQAVADFRAWLAANFSPEDIAVLYIDDAGYPGWQAVQTLVGELLKARQLSALSLEAKEHLLYLIARNWDVGSLLAWMNKDQILSNVGPLAEVDFLQLAHAATQLRHPEYDDAKFQVAICCRKLPALTQEIEEILLALFATTGHDYTRHQALHSLAALGYPNLLPLLTAAWEASAEEHYKIALLHIIADYVPDPALLRHYLALAEAVPGAYLADHVRRLRRSLAAH